MAGDFPPSSRETFLRLVLEEAELKEVLVNADAQERSGERRRAKLTLDDAPSGTSGTGERNLVNVRVLDNRLSGCRTIPANNRNNTGRNPSLVDQSTELQRRKRSLFTGLEDDHVSAGESGCDFPAEHEKGEVPLD